jgi:UDP-N-acetylglucosamine:LPS N-acetylglucosamine transferase
MKKKIKLALVCSSGGHLLQLYSLQDFWQNYERVWISFKKEDAVSVLKNEKKYWAYHPTNRNIINFFKNLFLALQIIINEKPSHLVSSGAGVAVPFFYLAKMLGIKTIFIESITFVEKPSLTFRLVYPIANIRLVQWPELAKKYPKAIYKGQVYDLLDSRD